MSESKAIRAAATVVLARDGAEGMELFMLRRSARSSFMANAMVYPGGAVDPEDFTLAQSPYVRAKRGLWDDDHNRAHAIAALREAFEEAGLLAAEFQSPPKQEALDRLRVELHERRMSFAQVLEELGAYLSLESIWYFDRWVTPSWETKRFDTQFFLMRAPQGQIARSDEQEVTDGVWLRAEEALRLFDRQKMLLAPPTWAVLRDLHAFATVEEAATFAEQATPYPILPHFIPNMDGKDGGLVLLPGDPEYPAPEEVDTTVRGVPRRTRIGMHGGLWLEMDDPRWLSC